MMAGNCAIRTHVDLGGWRILPGAAGGGVDGIWRRPLLVSTEEFASRIRSRNAQIKALLLDQSVLRGVGNIYTDESLWRAKIHPMRRGITLSKKQAQVLWRVLQDVLRKAILARGRRFPTS